MDSIATSLLHLRLGSITNACWSVKNISALVQAAACVPDLLRLALSYHALRAMIICSSGNCKQIWCYKGTTRPGCCKSSREQRPVFGVIIMAGQAYLCRSNSNVSHRLHLVYNHVAFEVLTMMTG